MMRVHELYLQAHVNLHVNLRENLFECHPGFEDMELREKFIY